MSKQEYKFDTYLAVGIAEGFEEAESEEQTVAAWQYLIDNDICWSLQGWFGRTASDLIDRGICSPKELH